ncbi:MAG TPA: rhomboid family intramembrane serine protease [archaeon]|nr:rhomboid family intramembrane serine protease [archaeon]
MIERGGRKRHAYRAPVATFFLAAFTVAVYLVLSKGSLFIDQFNFYKYAFGIAQAPGNVFNYLFVHTGPIHLVLNLVFLVLYGFIAEQSLQRKDVLAVYLVSGAAGAVAYSLLTPDTVLVGSSTAVYGLFGAAMLVSPKQTIAFSIALTALATYVLVPQVSVVEESVLKNTALELEERLAVGEKVKEELGQAAAAKKETQAIVEGLEAQKTELEGKGLPTAEIESALSERETELMKASEKVQALENESKKIEIQVSSIAERKKTHEEGRQREESAPIAIASHAVSSFFGSMYVFLLRREKVYDLESLEVFKWLFRRRRQPAMDRKKRR